TILPYRLDLIAEKHRSWRDFTLGSPTTALREIIAAFPVYRTYVGALVSDAEYAEGGPETVPVVSQEDREYIARAVTHARRRTPSMSTVIYDFVQDVLTMKCPE